MTFKIACLFNDANCCDCLGLFTWLPQTCKYVSNNQPRGFGSVRISNGIDEDKSEECELPTQHLPLNGNGNQPSPVSSQPATRTGSTVRTMVIPKLIFTPQNAGSNSSLGAVRRKQFRSHAFNHKVVVSNADEALKAFQLRQAKRKAKDVAGSASSDSIVTREKKMLSEENVESGNM